MLGLETPESGAPLHPPKSLRRVCKRSGLLSPADSRLSSQPTPILIGSTAVAPVEGAGNLLTCGWREDITSTIPGKVAGCPILAGLVYARVGLGFSASSSSLPDNQSLFTLALPFESF